MFSGCEKCYETPCSCGCGYDKLTPDQLDEQIRLLQGLLEKRKRKAGQVWVTTRGRYVYLIDLIMPPTESLGFIWYSEATGKLEITEVQNQLDKLTNLTFADWVEWVQDNMDEQERMDDQEGN